MMTPFGSDTDAVFLTKLSVGTPSDSQTFDLLVDTGSSWNWVNTCSGEFQTYRDQAKNNATCPSYYFDSKKSPTLSCSSEQKYIRYGSGATLGTICEDEIKVPFT